MPALDALPDDFRDFLVELADANAELGSWEAVLSLQR